MSAPVKWQKAFRDKLVSADEAMRRVKSGDLVRFVMGPVPVTLVKALGHSIFIATKKRLYISRDGQNFQPVFSLVSGDASEFLEIEEIESSDEIDLGESSSDFHEMIKTNENSILHLATRRGIFRSSDGGQTWRPLSRSGLQSTDILFLAESENPGALFAGTSRGIYEYIPAKKRWKEIFEGLARPETRALTVLEDGKTNLIAATPDGIMRHIIFPDQISPAPFEMLSPDRTQLFAELIRMEPNAVRVHKAVMKFSNLKNGKIKRWQTESRLAALLPGFSFGRDFSKNNNVDIDRAGTNEPDKFILGPSDVDRGWDMDVSWDLGDFIYSSNQASIDGREKLMVELRNDFLSEATRIYYERRRLQVEIVFSPAQSEEEYYDQILRLEELTALLDSMTGGWMSQELEKIYENNPEFGRLWEIQNPKT